MGKVIERIALERGHEIVLKKSSATTFEGIENADVAIDFSIPDVAVENITTCLEKGIPVISGTTGWLDEYQKMRWEKEMKAWRFEAWNSRVEMNSSYNE